MPTDIPIFINCRDRVSDLRRLVCWLEDAGHTRITLLDNDSSYEPMLDYLFDTSHEVVPLAQNMGPRALWYAGLVPNERFVYTDPDVLPHEVCPTDLVARLGRLMDDRPGVKVGPGFYVGDMPKDMPYYDYVTKDLRSGNSVGGYAYESSIDTTFALYPPDAGFSYDAICTRFPYEIRHTTWYGWFDEHGQRQWGPQTDEERFYLGRAEGGFGYSTWKEWSGYESQVRD